MQYFQVVKVYATAQEPDFESPWQVRSPLSGTGSGVIIGPGEVLTGAHVVANSTFIQVQKLSTPDKAVARVKTVCHDCDLALLEVGDPGFTEDVDPLEIADFANQGDEVAVVGYPIGGEEVSVTEGVVSRIEVQRYDHSQRYLLAATVDAAINAGNSGGPVFKNGKVAGIAFQKLEQADNIGEVVPAPLIRHFLEGIASGREARIPGLGTVTQNLENPLMRKALGLASDQSGVLVSAVLHGGSAWGVLRPRDVILEMGGYRLASNGTVSYRGRYRTLFDGVLGEYYVGDVLPLTVLRDGRPQELTLTLAPYVDLVPRSQYEQAPTYLVYGGLVFQPLSRDLLATWEEWWRDAPAEFLSDYYAGICTQERQQVVVLSRVLADEINVGYEQLYNESVVSVNGVEPRHMADFARMLDSARGTVEIQTSRHGTVMFDTEEVRAATPRILARYHVPHDRSADLGPLATGEEPASASSVS